MQMLVLIRAAVGLDWVLLAEESWGANWQQREAGTSSKFLFVVLSLLCEQELRAGNEKETGQTEHA